MLNAVALAVMAGSLLGSRFDASVKTAKKQRKPILLIVTEPKNREWRAIQKEVFSRKSVSETLEKVLILTMPSTAKIRSKIAEHCDLETVRTPFFGLFDCEGEFIASFTAKVKADSLKASIISACVVARKRWREVALARISGKARASPQATKLRLAEMCIRNNALDAAKRTLETVAREYPGTPEAEKAASYLAELEAGRKPTLQPRSSGEPAKDLRMARMLITTEAVDAAKEKLRGILTSHPGTPEAEEARALLSEME